MVQRKKSEFINKKKGAEVQWGLFKEFPQHIYNGETSAERELSVELSNVRELISRLHEFAISDIKDTEKGSLKAIQKAAIDAIFDIYSNIISPLPATAQLGEYTHHLFEFINTLVFITAFGAYDEGTVGVFDFLKEGLNTDNLTEKLKKLIETHDKMRGKKLSKEREALYSRLKKKWESSTKNQEYFNLKQELDKLLSKNGKKYTDSEKRKIISGFYQWRIRSSKIKNTLC